MSEELYHDVVKESRDRGERLRRIRNLANLSRKDLCDESGININTYIGYEVGRYGGLTKKGAYKIIEYLSSKGVYSSFEWIMNGLGLAPRVETDINQHVSVEKLDLSSENLRIAEEITLFRKHYKNSFDYQIIDDGMLPIYDMGDYVGGICHISSAVDELIGYNCILQMENGEVIVRNLSYGRKENHYTLSCTNPETGVNLPIIFDVKLIFAAKIIWHRKLYLKDTIIQPK
jgi:transcriptional regulator with XRE-family HTH domain